MKIQANSCGSLFLQCARQLVAEKAREMRALAAAALAAINSSQQALSQQQALTQQQAQVSRRLMPASQQQQQSRTPVLTPLLKTVSKSPRGQRPSPVQQRNNCAQPTGQPILQQAAQQMQQRQQPLDIQQPQLNSAPLALPPRQQQLQLIQQPGQQLQHNVGQASMPQAIQQQQVQQPMQLPPQLLPQLLQQSLQQQPQQQLPQYTSYNNNNNSNMHTIPAAHQQHKTLAPHTIPSKQNVPLPIPQQTNLWQPSPQHPQNLQQGRQPMSPSLHRSHSATASHPPHSPLQQHSTLQSNRSPHQQSPNLLKRSATDSPTQVHPSKRAHLPGKSCNA